jgi:stringent starvation protein B
MKVAALALAACACASAFLIPVAQFSSSSSSALHGIKRDMNVAQHYGLDVNSKKAGIGSMFDDAAMLALIDQNAKKTEEQEKAEKTKKDDKDASTKEATQ